MKKFYQMQKSNNKKTQDTKPSHIPSKYHRPPPEKINNYYFAKNRKNIHKKYYGRKIIFVEKQTHMTAAINRSKYLLRFRMDSEVTRLEDFKALANMIIFNTNLFLRPHFIRRQWFCPRYPNIHPLQLKKTLRSCKNPQLQTPHYPLLQLNHLKHLFHLKSLTLYITNEYSMRKASKAITKLRLLQSLEVKYLYDYHEDPNFPIKLKGGSIVPDSNDKKSWGFFYKVSKLPRLERFSLQTSLKTLEQQSMAAQQDFSDFYLRSHKFKLNTEVYVSSNLDIPELTAKNMRSVLKTADSLSIQMGIRRPYGRDHYTCQDRERNELSEQEKVKILKQGERPVKFYIAYIEKLQVNIGCVLSQCENLVSLYLKISSMEIVWDQHYESFPHKLQNVVLDVNVLGLKYEILDDSRPPSRFQLEEKSYEIAGQKKVKFHCGLLELLKQLKTRAAGLEAFTLFMCLPNFKKSWYCSKPFKELFEKVTEEKAKEFFKELESFEKFHGVAICKRTGYLEECLKQTLEAKSLKKVRVGSVCVRKLHNIFGWY